MQTMSFLSFCLLFILTFSCKAPFKVIETRLMIIPDKIYFDYESLDKNGLIGPSDGLVSVDYEFCIPTDKDLQSQALSMDPSLKILDSQGRSRCKKGEVLAMGNTQQANAKRVLEGLSSLTFVGKINRVWFE